MNRREVLKNVAFWAGGAFSITALGVVYEGCQPKSSKKEGLLFNEELEMTIAEIANTIIPDTDTPGAKAAGVGPFIVMMINECYPQDIQKVFIKGIEDVQKRSESDYDKPFTAISSSERETLINTIEKEAKTHQKNNVGQEGKGISSHYFFLIKELTVLGYFTSQIGASQALTYIEVPGRYDGCMPLKKGQKAWAT
ncbi:MAG: gluconate 2-dehydrogenase subunit 3 family protein [Chitinophagaceae bacterium]